MKHNESQNEIRLNEFFEMFDAVEDDIAELVSDKNEEPSEIGGYECLFIAFSNLRLYCDNSGIRLKQIEEQYKELKKSHTKEESGILAVDEDLNENNEVVNFCKLLEQIENSFSALEKRCEKSGEVFDEWTCVLLMYSYLRNYCVKEKVDFEKLQEEILRLHSEMDKNKNP
jgi:flagellar biosynthesis chaperone FliJ